MNTAAMTWSPLAGLRALITGGSAGIGLATVDEFMLLGADVAVLDIAQLPPGRATMFVAADVSDDASVRAAVDTVVSKLGGLDIVVNNAGIGAQGTIEDNTDEEWQHVFDVNVLGIVRVSRAALSALRESRHPAIINTCSVAAEIGMPRRALYSASKGAVLALTRAMAADHLYDGIRVNCVNPGTADTPWIGRLLSAAADPGAERAALMARQPHGRLVSAREVATVIAYFAGPTAGSTTGTSLTVDGGLVGLRLPARDAEVSVPT